MSKTDVAPPTGLHENGKPGQYFSEAVRARNPSVRVERRGRLTSLLLKARSPALCRRSNARAHVFSGSIAERRICVVLGLLRANAPYGHLSESIRWFVDSVPSGSRGRGGCSRE